MRQRLVIVDRPGRGVRQCPHRPASRRGDAQPVEGDDTGPVNEPEEYGSLTVEDDPQGTVDPADVAGTADESDEDVS